MHAAYSPDLPPGRSDKARQFDLAQPDVIHNATMTSKEPFPLLHTGTEHVQVATGADTPRRRRISSAVGDDIRAGDTGAALATRGSHLTDWPERKVCSSPLQRPPRALPQSS